jgi:hypothetical protein
MVFNGTFNTISVISWPSDLLLEETGGLGEGFSVILHLCITYDVTSGHVVSLKDDRQ